MNTPVSFPLAKLLKEKGFDKITESLWHFNGSECIKMPNKNSENLGFSAPTIAEVVMWLYKKYGIWINPIPRLSSWIFTIQEIKTGNIESLIDIDFYETNEYLISKGIPTIMLSPTEAYEAAIKYTLKNLISDGKIRVNQSN